MLVLLLSFLTGLLSRKETRKQHMDTLAAQRAQDATCALCDSAITEGTLEQYCSRIRVLMRWLEEEGHPTLTQDLFGLYLVNRLSAGGQPSSIAEGYRSAILHFQTSRRMWLDSSGQPWASSDLCIRMCAGYKYNSKITTKRPRGQVDQYLFPTLKDWLTAHYRQLVPAAEVMYGVGLRSHALIELHKGSYTSARRLLRHADKRANAKNGLPPFCESVVVDERAHFILSQRDALCPEAGDLYFPLRDWSLALFRRAMKEAATALDWPEELIFDGPHTLRHGAVAHIDEDWSPEEAQLALPLSNQMRKHYGRNNSTRIAEWNKRNK